MLAVTPFIPLSELAFRRQKIADLLPKSSLVILPANPILTRNSDIELPFRQESMFWYFTGINQPNACLSIYKDMRGVTEFSLHIEDINEELEIWNGKRMRVEEASSVSGLSSVFYISEQCDQIPHLLNKARSLWVTAGHNANHVLHHFFPQIAVNKKLNSVSIKRALSQLRMYKSDWEIEQLIHSANLNISAHQATKKLLDSAANLSEFHLQAELEYYWKRVGCTFSYPAIVAAGNNATTLHYVQNTSPISPADLVLIDAGCEYNYYASDITRTWSQSQASSAQKAIVDAVQKAHTAALFITNQQGSSILDVHKAATLSLIDSLIELKLLPGTKAEILESGSYAEFWPHSTSHWLGLDTHDFGQYKNESSQSIQLEQGLIFTIEPGLYIPQTADVPKEFQGIGVRLEDNIAITKTGAVNLTSHLEC